jgi:glucokinase-like ROK family protein
MRDLAVLPIGLGRTQTALTMLSITRSEKEIIEFIRKFGEATKPDLVEFTEFSRTKVTTCVDSLLSKKIIQLNGSGDYTGGRRSKTFSMNGKLGLVAGVDIGATSIDLVLSDFSGNMIGRNGEPANVREGPRVILTRLCELLKDLLRENNLRCENLSGIGIGVPGPVDFSLGTLVSPPIMPGWDGYPIVSTIQEQFPYANVVVDNDVNVMALGETSRGAGRGVDNLIFVKIGTGIGAGIICGGKIYRGTSGCAGDIGHICVNKNGPICHCGNTGCLEALAAGPAIAERGVKTALDGSSPVLMKYYENNGGKLRSEDIGDAAREGDTSAIEIIRESGQKIGEVLASLVNFYNPSMIVIGGGVSNIGNLLLSSIRQAVLNRSLPLATRDLQIVFSAIGSDAGVMGLTTLAMDYMFKVEASND